MTALRELLYLPTSPTYWPRGIECIFDYNNSACVLNDIRRQDQIVVTGVGGLGDPDLSANAEKNPGADGEYPQDATYGGRTITLRGYVRSGSLDGMRRLFSYVKDGFDTVAEAPLWLRYLDWRDPFTDGNALVDYAYDAGSGTVVINSSGAGLQPTSTANKQIRLLPLKNDGTTPSRFTYGDGEAILKFRAGTALTGLVAGVEFRRSSSTRKLRVLYEKATDTLRLYKLDTSTTQLATVASTTLVVGTDYWIRVRAEGAVITFSLWTTYPPDTGTTGLLATQSATLSGGDLALYPASTSGLGWGIYWTPNSTTDRIGLLDVGAINPGDAVIFCRKAVPIDPGEETQEGFEWVRNFMITLRASDSRMVSRKVTLISVSPPTPAVSQEYLAISATNYGRSPAALTLTFDKGAGTLKAPDLWLPSTDKRIGSDAPLGVTGSIFEPDIDTLVFNTQRHTVIDELGNPRYSALSSETTWAELLPGVNAFRVTSERASTFEGVVAATALNGLTFHAAETWATSGATTDWTIANLTAPDQLPYARVEYARRQTTAETGNGRIGLAGTTNYTDATAYVQLRLSALPYSAGVTNEFGLILRYVDASNYFRVVIYFVSVGVPILYYIRRVAGVETITGSLSLAVAPVPANYWFEIETTIRADGRFATWLNDPSTKSTLWSDEQALGIDFATSTTATWPLQHSTLAPAGALATGKIGMIDKNNTGIASSRYVAKLGIRSAMVGGRVDLSYRHSSR